MPVRRCMHAAVSCESFSSATSAFHKVYHRPDSYDGPCYCDDAAVPQPHRVILYAVCPGVEVCGLLLSLASTGARRCCDMQRRHVQTLRSWYMCLLLFVEVLTCLLCHPCLLCHGQSVGHVDCMLCQSLFATPSVRLARTRCPCLLAVTFEVCMLAPF
jgi:hypothetical protein